MMRLANFGIVVVDGEGADSVSVRIEIAVAEAVGESVVVDISVKTEEIVTIYEEQEKN